MPFQVYKPKIGGYSQFNDANIGLKNILRRGKVLYAMRRDLIWLIIILFATMLAGGIYLLLHPGIYPRESVPHKLINPKKINPKPAQVKMTNNFAVPALMYHRVGYILAPSAKSKLAQDLTVDPETFRDQMKYLADNGFAVLSTEVIEKAVLKNKALPEKAVAVTFDDGYEDCYNNAFPVLRKYKMPATVFIVATTIGTPGHLTWAEARTMERYGIKCGSHSFHHIDLTQLSLSQLDNELRQSRQVIDSHLKVDANDIAYPAGRVNQIVAARAARAGYRAAWLKSGGPVRPGSNLYLLPRIRISGSCSMAEFGRRVSEGHKMSPNTAPNSNPQ